ncbi:MAG: hypothetical protein M1813_007843 [Trichoglossum hirsutum]|jgi:hypothetical protein|nr:MAG: hypothetical protein M1813_007843 [Trichoglossum hirsutum]
MAYNAVAQREHDAFSDDANDSNASGSPPLHASSFPFQPLSMDISNMGGSLFMAKAAKPAEQTRTATASAATSYDMLDSEDEEADAPIQHGQRHTDGQVSPQINSGNRRSRRSPGENSTSKNIATWQNEDEPVIVPRTVSPEPMMRTASSEGSVDLRHPVPDLQSMQGAYVGNVERLERSAERLSMTSDINEELRKLKLEQKRSESRSSVRGSHHEEGVATAPLATRKFSSNSVSNSIVGVNNAARSGGYSPGGWISSRGGSIRSSSFSQSTGLRLTQISGQESDQDGGQLHSSMGANVPTIPPPVPRHGSFARQHDNGSLGKFESDRQATESLAEPEITAADTNRPVTSASVDTFQQANQLFTDFDGVHFTPHLQDPSASASGQSGTRRVSISLSLTGRQSYVEPQGDQKDQNMVFYPAPVPALLNLPKRLSKLPSATQREQRRSQVLDSLPTTARRSATWLPGLEEASASAEDLTSEERRQSKHVDPRRSMANLAGLPPQLRASAFFDQPATRQDVQVKEDSAVATLDSILDASANAPVSAFTDHPIVGRVGAEVYGRENARKSTSNLLAPSGNLKKKASRDDLNLAGKGGSRSSFAFLTKRRHSAEEADEDDERDYGDSHPLSPGEEERLSEDGEDTGESTEGEEADEKEEDGQYFGAPTTLLAELQIRKQEQRMRNRTAANAFPNGMHSTLLELDAVAQIQRESRRNKRVALAWEDPNVHGPGSDDEDDDDVPLAMLYADKINDRYDEDRPLGLMEKREMEDNEPLSRRRDRLKGGPTVRKGVSPNQRASTMYQLEVPHISGQENSVDGSDEEEETLAARIARLKAKGTATGLAEEVSTDFAADLISKFGGEKQKDEAVKDGKGKEGDSPDEEETLGQRKKRLQAEREARAKEQTGGDQQPGLSQLKQRRSLANILQAHPVGGLRKVSNENPGLGGAADVGGLLHQHQQLKEQRSQQLREHNKFGSTGGLNAPPVFAGDESAGIGHGHQQHEMQRLQQMRQQNALINAPGADPRLSQLQPPQMNLNNRGSFAAGLYNDGSGGMTSGMGGYGGHNSGMGMNAYGSGGLAASMGYQHMSMGGMGGMSMGMHMNGYAPQPAAAAGGMGYANPMGNQSTTMMQMGEQMAALDARQREMVERWRQSVM